MRTSSRSAIMLLSVLTLVWFLGVGAWDASAVSFGGHEINFLGATYDPGENATTFTYQVTAASTPDTLVKLYYWILELDPECFGAGDVIDASESYQYAGPDPNTGVYGIVFDQPYAPGETRTVWFRLPGNLSVVPVEIVVRVGCTNWRKEISGPTCIGKPCPPPECDVTPDRDSVCVGTNVTFTASATGTPPITYCWQKEPYTDPCISVTDQLTLYDVTFDDEGTYRVIVTDECGADTCYAVLIVDECPPEGEGKSPGYWGTQLAKYLGYKKGKLLEPNIESYAAQYGYTAQQAYDIMWYDGNDMVDKLHRQLLAAKLSTAAGYLSGVDALLEEGQYMVAHPEEFTQQELEDAKDLFESLHD